jgi:FMN-dependent NADH-azoreductase
MPKLLHIKASPRAESFSAQAAEAFIEAFLQAHRDWGVETLDLFRANIPVFEAPQAAAKYDVLAGKEPTGPAGRAWKAVIDTIDHFKSADAVVISCPMWNFSIPYRLKQYLDVIVQPALTFSYAPAEGYKGLVTGRPAVLVLARGGNYAPGSGSEAYDSQKPYLEGILRFIGFTDIRSLIVEPTLAGEEAARKALAAAKAQAAELAKALY